MKGHIIVEALLKAAGGYSRVGGARPMVLTPARSTIMHVIATHTICIRLTGAMVYSIKWPDSHGGPIVYIMPLILVIGSRPNNM